MSPARPISLLEDVVALLHLQEQGAQECRKELGQGQDVKEAQAYSLNLNCTNPGDRDHTFLYLTPHQTTPHHHTELAVCDYFPGPNVIFTSYIPHRTNINRGPVLSLLFISPEAQCRLN